MRGLRLAVSWLTVLPVHVEGVDARTARHAIAFAPLVGALLGAVAAVLLWGLVGLSAPPLLAGAVTVAVLALATRGMHVDGLADTVDGLGCYGPSERALSVMRDGNTGPFAVVALIIVLTVQTVAFASLATTDAWFAVVLACAVGRGTFLIFCRNGMPAARPEGLGALVAGSQPRPNVFAWWLVLPAAGLVARPHAWWIGVIAVGVTGIGLWALSIHVRGRFGGITGDVLGASSELGTTGVLAICALGTGFA